MPEGHTIHRLARQVGARFQGRVITATSPQGRFTGGAARVDGRELTSVDAHGKHLFLGVDEEWVHIHLGLFGSVSVSAASAAVPARGAVRLRLACDDSVLDLRGPTVCEVITAGAKQTLHARLGADPLRRDADPDAVFARVQRRRLGMGALLLDQSLVAGIGNVYRAELLHRAAVSPFREGRALTRPEWVGLWDDTVRQLRAVLPLGRDDATRARPRT